MPCVSNEYGVLKMHADKNDSETSSSLLAFIQILDILTAHVVSFGTWQSSELTGQMGDFVN